jgi:hypothetical protein
VREGITLHLITASISWIEVVGPFYLTRIHNTYKSRKSTALPLRGCWTTVSLNKPQICTAKKISIQIEKID